MLLVGLGPAGQVLANLLGGLGVAVVALDRASGPHGEPRATACDDEVLGVLEGVGVDLEADGRLSVPERVELLGADGRTAFALRPGRGKHGRPALALFHQPDLERALLARLAGRASVWLGWGWELERFGQDGGGVTAWVRAGRGPSRPVRARYLVAGDGARSPVRAACGIAFRGRSFAQPWLVVDAEVDPPVFPAPRVQFVGDPRRPAVSMTRAPGQHRWEFLVASGEDPAALRAAELVAPWVAPGQARVTRSVVYTFHARQAERWRHGRVLLLGDAAHVMPPFAGQGLGAGIRDAASLAPKLAAVLRGEAASSLLDAYEAERRPDVEAVTRLAVLWGALVQTRRPRLARTRDAALRGVRRVPRLGPWLEGGGVLAALGRR